MEEYEGGYLLGDLIAPQWAGVLPCAAFLDGPI